MSFYGNTYKSGNQLFMREKDSKNDKDLYMKVAIHVMFTQMSANAGIKRFG